MTPAWRPPDKRKAPNGWRPGASQEETNDNNDTAVVIGFPVKRSFCHGCGIGFRPMRAWHNLCRVCWRWIRAGEHIEAARLLREVGR
jgi:hypothetical protein